MTVINKKVTVSLLWITGKVISISKAVEILLILRGQDNRLSVEENRQSQFD